ncbi:cyclic nucleotide-gated ion channel 4-like [Phalaenopsis equestris]|uniref:cyclic nucleotide-gated ion channel 4-like n=1 Tax=Phalaenopsis equestris TaxID=78828 RepID=UPI0009E459CE|nr:cyclic nucleotide-gated ion channel 4-like [Phalaenopsis equestris]
MIKHASLRFRNPRPSSSITTSMDSNISNHLPPHNIDRDSDEETWSYNPPKHSTVGGAFDPQSKWVQEWNRAFLLVRASGLFVDPLFFYALSINGDELCLFVDGWFAATVTLLRFITDAVHLWNMWLKMKTVCHMRMCDKREDEGVEQNGRISKMSPQRAAMQYLKLKNVFFFDLFVVLPIPQVVLWMAVPALIKQGSTMWVMTIFLIMFLFQYLPKIYHSISSLRRLQNSSGYIFGTIWWGIALNLIAYFIASHAVGACWYLLGIQRATKCLTEQCRAVQGCWADVLGCIEPIYYGNTAAVGGKTRHIWANSTSSAEQCLGDSGNNYSYGAYRLTVLLVANTSRLEKILLPLLWGLMTLTTFGGALVSTTDWLEIIFNIVVITSGLILVTMLIGNIKVFLHSTTCKKKSLHMKMRSLDWWMRQRQLPKSIRQRVRQYERQRWAAMRGVDECNMISNLPQGLRRDIKYHLCLDLVRQVPLFQHMDELVLENICDRVKSLVFPKGETITREGDPVQKMIFIVRGHLESKQLLRDGLQSCCMLGPGNFTGDELLSWCLRRPFVHRLPPSSSTLITLETTEAFGLEAADVKYVTQHFRYVFLNERVRRSARYYSPAWRTWAAVAIQLAWRNYKVTAAAGSGGSSSMAFGRPRRPASRCPSPGEERLRHYAAMLTSPKPNGEGLY